LTLTTRDANSNPVAYATVVIDFSDCVSQDIRLGSSQPDPGTLVHCEHKTVARITNAKGEVTFRIVGSADNGGNAAGHTCGCASVQADGMPVGRVTVAAYDQNLTGSVTSADQSRFAADFYGSQYRGRSDFNCTLTATSSDLSRFAAVFYGNGSTDPTAYCP
jgi:hypothetical protein